MLASNNTRTQGKTSNDKKAIQKNFKHRLGLIIDVPKQAPATMGTLFFFNPKVATKITGLDEEIIEISGNSKRAGLWEENRNCRFKSVLL